MQINQLKAKYLPLADRVLLSLNSQNEPEIQLLLTRRVAMALMEQITEIIEVLPNKRTELNKSAFKSVNQKKNKHEKKSPNNSVATAKLITQVTIKILQVTETPLFNLSFFFQDKSKLTLSVQSNFLEKILSLIDSLQEKAKWGINSNRQNLLKSLVNDKIRNKLH